MYWHRPIPYSFSFFILFLMNMFQGNIFLFLFPFPFFFRLLNLRGGGDRPHRPPWLRHWSGVRAIQRQYENPGTAPDNNYVQKFGV